MAGTLSRRSLLKGAGAVSAAAMLAHYPGARLIRAQGGEEYDLIDFGAFETVVTTVLPSVQPNIAGRVYAVNQLGQSTGKIGASEERFSPAFWSESGRLRRLQSGQRGGKGHAVNDAGEVVGALFADAYDDWRPTVWRDGEPTVLPLVEGVTGGEARGINNEGVIVGVNQPGNVPVRWIDDQAETLPMPPGAVAAFATQINDAGTIGGTVVLEDRSTRRAVLWQSDGIAEIPVPDEIESGGAISFSALNGLDQLAVLIYNYSQAPIWDYYYVADATGVIRVVNQRGDGLSHRARDINDLGHVVGHAYGDDFRAAFLEHDGDAIDLNSVAPASDLHLYDAVGITNDGVIAGNADGADGLRHGFLLVPVG